MINLHTTPLILIGRSIGGLYAAHIGGSTIGQKMFKAIVQITPCFEMYSDSLRKKLPLMKVLQWVAPYKVFDTKKKISDG
jgi:hypothetical protein